MRYAVADTGSNTIRLGVYEYNETENQLTLLHNEAIFANLAAYIENGALTAEGIAVAADALRYHEKTAEGYGCPLNVFATAAIRNAVNCDEIIKSLQALTGISVDVLTGEEEAQLSFFGAISDFPKEKGIMIDVGGGSSEVIYYENGKIQALTSVPWGSLKAFKAFVHEGYPTEAEANEIKHTVLSYVKENAALSAIQCENLCIAGGGVGASAKLAATLLNTTQITVATIDTLLSQLMYDENNAQEAVVRIAPKRAATLGPGLAIYSAFGHFFGAKNVFLSDKGIKEGYILRRLCGFPSFYHS